MQLSYNQGIHFGTLGMHKLQCQCGVASLSLFEKILGMKFPCSRSSPGVEVGSAAWKANVITTIPLRAYKGLDHKAQQFLG